MTQIVFAVAAPAIQATKLNLRAGLWHAFKKRPKTHTHTQTQSQGQNKKKA